MQSNLLERMNAQNLQRSVEASGQFQLLVQYGYQQICRHSDPNLSFHRVEARSVIVLDPQIALDPFEKQLDIPALLVKFGNRQRRKFHVVGQEHQIALLLGIEKPNPPQRRRKVFSRFGQRQIPDLIAAKPRCFVHDTRFLPRETQIVLGAGYKKRPGGCDALESGKVDVALVEKIDRSGFEHLHVQPLHIVHTGWRHEHANRNRSPQIDLSVHLDSALGRAEGGPRKHRQRQVNCRRVQSVDGVFQIQTQILARVKTSGFRDQAQSQRLPQSPIPPFVGIGQSRFGHGFPKPQVVKCLGFGVEAFDDIAQTIAPSHLSKDHANQLLAHSEMPHTRVGMKARSQSGEGLAMNQIEDLAEDEATGYHPCSIASAVPKKTKTKHPQNFQNKKTDI